MPNLLAGRYELGSVIGGGGMGTVHLAKHATTGRFLAIKVVSIEAGKKKSLVDRLKREATLMGGIQSPHVVGVYDAGIDEGQEMAFIAMEYLRGVDLRSLVKAGGPLESETVRRVAAQCCVGLEAAHRVGVIHRDIKPSNIFLARRTGDVGVTTSGRGDMIVKLVDFGIAKRSQVTRASDETDLTHTGAIVGSSHYMSPEQAQGLDDIDARTDIWSLGISMLYLLAGKTPTHGIESAGRVLLAICAGDPIRVADLCSEVPAPLTAVIEKAVQRDPEKRFQTASEMLFALRDAGSGDLILSSDDFEMATVTLKKAPDELRPTSAAAELLLGQQIAIEYSDEEEVADRHGLSYGDTEAPSTAPETRKIDTSGPGSGQEKTRISHVSFTNEGGRSSVGAQIAASFVTDPTQLDRESIDVRVEEPLATVPKKSNAALPWLVAVAAILLAIGALVFRQSGPASTSDPSSLPARAVPKSDARSASERVGATSKTAAPAPTESVQPAVSVTPKSSAAPPTVTNRKAAKTPAVGKRKVRRRSKSPSPKPTAASPATGLQLGGSGIE